MKNTVIVGALLLASSTVLAKPTPPPLKLITQEGGEVISNFPAPDGMTGYIVDFNGRTLTVYLTPSKQYMFAGVMLDDEGVDQAQKALNEYLAGPKSEKDWQALESSNWVLDGSPDAERIVYTFTDPNCPYCKQFFKAARPWVEAGDVQLRHILVGILKADSLAKAAAILGADRPSEWLHLHETEAKTFNLVPNHTPTAKVNEMLENNHAVMHQLGVSATPTTFYKNHENIVVGQPGLPPRTLMEEIMGSAKD